MYFSYMYICIFASLQLCYNVEWSDMHIFFSALTVVVGQQEEHLVYKSFAVTILKRFPSGTA